MTGEQPITRTGDNVWRVAQADRASVVIDADEYFAVARRAMVAARDQIWLIGWDFDACIPLGDASEDDGPEKLGGFVHWLAERSPGLRINILRWDTGALRSLLRPTTLAYLVRWMFQPRITIRLDSCHPFGSSHHQKIVVIDGSMAFCGGIDMTAGRWDRREHADKDPRRVLPGGKQAKPWHDATFALHGPAAAALADLANDRWVAAGGKPQPVVSGARDNWPAGLGVQFTDVAVGIARSIPQMPEREPVREIELLFADMIRAAKSHIYIENQYFASRTVALALAERLAEADCPEILIVQATTAEGWLEPIAMDGARAAIMEQLMQVDVGRRLRLYHPHTTGGEGIYVHAKIFIVDDRMVRVGSANLNNRSMRLDTECDIVLDSCGQDDAPSVAAAIVALRDGLLAEHVGVSVEEVSAVIRQAGSMFAVIDRYDTNGQRLRPYVAEENNAVSEFLAVNQLLDPEGPEEMFEPVSRRRGLSGIRDRWRQRRSKAAGSSRRSDRTP